MVVGSEHHQKYCSTPKDNQHPHTWMQTFTVLSICLVLDTGLPNTPSHDSSPPPQHPICKVASETQTAPQL